jgi:N-succinyldiaminopimelate aminotransferase
MAPRLSQRVAGFGTTIFSEMSRLAAEHGAVNLGQGFPDFDGPDPVKEAAILALRAGQNQYAVGIGQPALRQAIAAHARRFYNQTVDPDSEVTVTSGATETLFAAVQGLVDPGDEVVILEPYYDAYVPDVLMAGGVPRLVPMRPPDWTFDPDELAAAFNDRTRLILLNTPHNPTGRVFSQAELGVIAALCRTWDVVAVSDEVYEHLVYDDARHVRLATLPGMEERTVSVSSLGKTFSFTGWKVGWAVAPPALTAAVRRAHQWITFATATPLQAAGAVALGLDDEFYLSFTREFQARRDFLADVLQNVGLRISQSQGTYFIMADFSGLDHPALRGADDVAFCRWLTTEVGVAAIPPTAFYSDAHKPLARQWARFAFCKRRETLEHAAERLQRLRSV